jgi:hypothetical protein
MSTTLKSAYSKSLVNLAPNQTYTALSTDSAVVGSLDSPPHNAPSTTHTSPYKAVCLISPVRMRRVCTVDPCHWLQHPRDRAPPITTWRLRRT